MSISFSCERCGKTYKLDESLAGKKAKCKQCGNEFRIPEPVMARATSAGSAADPYGLDDGELAPLPPRYDAEFSAHSAPKPKRAGIISTSSRSSSGKKPFVAAEQLRSMGLGFLGFGVLVLVLPFFNLQHRAFANLPMSAQIGGGLFIAFLGIVSLLFSCANANKTIAYLVVGFLGCLGLCASIVVFRGGASMPNVPSSPIQVAASKYNPPIPAPVSVPVPAQPTKVAFAEFPDPPAPPPDVPPQTGATQAKQGQIKIKLTNARMWKEQNRRFPAKPFFSVDYKVEEGTGRGGFKYVWVIQTAGTRASMDIFRMETEGRLEGSMFGPTAPGGPYECYMALETFGRRGKDMVKVSDTVTMQELGSRPTDPAPKGRPLPPGPAIANGNNGGGPMPGTPALAPRPVEPPKPATNDEITNLIADMKARDSFKARAGADKLAKQAPVDERREEVIATLLTLTDDRDSFTRNSGAAALAVWGTVKELDTWLKLVDDENFTVRWTAMAALAEIKDPKGADAVAHRYRADKIKASEALTKMGSVAEPAVQAMLKDVEWSIRMDGCKILKTIGTKDSLPLLNKALRDENGLVRMAAEEAVKALSHSSTPAKNASESL